MSMSLTDLEWGRLHDALKKIMSFVAEQKPYLRDGVHIEFGKYEYGSYEHELTAYDGRLFGRSGYLGIDFKEDSDHSVFDKGCGGSFAQDLVREWPRIKNAIMEEVEREKAFLADLNSFEV